MRNSLVCSLRRATRISVSPGSYQNRALTSASNILSKSQHQDPSTSTFLPPQVTTRSYSDDSDSKIQQSPLHLGLLSHCNFGKISESVPQLNQSSNLSRESKDDVVLVEKMEKFHIMTIGLNRPEKRNSVDTYTGEVLKEAFQDFETDDNMKIAVVHGLGGNFSAGYDLEELSELEEDISNKVAEILMDQGPMGPTKMEFSKPVIAAISGYCVAGGLELAIMCDLRVVEENSKLGFLNRRFGVPLIDGATVRLPALIGLSRAMDLILTGRIIEPKEAHEWGLANRVVTTGTAFGQALNLAKEIVKFPQECLKADMESTIYATYSAKYLSQALNFETEHSARVLTTEAIIGAKKFAAGLGKHGKFNVYQVSGKEELQKELEEMKKSMDKQ